MRNQFRQVAGSTVACSLLLAACGGGGGGTSPTVPGSTPTPSPTPAPLVAKSVARADAQTALAAVQSYQVLQGGSTVLGMTRRALDLHRGRKPQIAVTVTVAVCNPNTLTGGSSSFTSTTDVAGNQIDTYSTFYDASCIKPEAVEVITFPPGSPSRAGAIFTTFDQTGAVSGYATLTISTQLGIDTFSITIQANTAKAVGGAPFGELGLTCMTSPNGGGYASCGIAAVSTVGTPTGIVLTIFDTFSAGPPRTISETFHASTYGGTNLGIAIGDGNAWNVTGGTLTDTISGTVTITLSDSTPIGGSLAATDATTGVAIAGTMAATGMQLTLSKSGTVVATVTLDANGNGTITYADGTTEKVTAYTIVG